MIIPGKIYRLVEEKLKNRWLLVPRAMQRLYEAQYQASAVSAKPTDAVSVISGGGKSRVEKAALLVLDAETRLSEAQRWRDAIDMTDKAFPWETAPEGVLAGYLYGNGMTLSDAARAAGCSRKTAQRLRDNYVGHCALFAASMGLIRFEEKQECISRDYGKGGEVG